MSFHAGTLPVRGSQMRLGGGERVVGRRTDPPSKRLQRDQLPEVPLPPVGPGDRVAPQTSAWITAVIMTCVSNRVSHR